MSILSKFVALCSGGWTSCPNCGHSIWYSSMGTYSKRCDGCDKIVTIKDGEAIGWR